MKNVTVPILNPLESPTVKKLTMGAYLARYKKMVRMSLDASLGQEFDLSTGIVPSLSGSFMLRLVLKVNSFEFCVYEILAEKNLGKDATINRSELILAGHTVGSYVYWALACRDAMEALYKSPAISTYVRAAQQVAGDSVWVGELAQRDKLNASAVFVSFGYGVTSDDMGYATAVVRINHGNDALEEEGAHDIPLAEGMFRTTLEPKVNGRALTSNCLNAPFVAILNAASRVELNHYYFALGSNCRPHFSHVF